MNKIVIKKLNNMYACIDAVEWANSQPNKQAAWDNCERGDWMLWLLGRLSGKPESTRRKKLVLCVCDCAALALKHSGKNRKFCEKAINTAKAWARGKATIKEVQAAICATDDTYVTFSADDAYAAYAAYTAYAIAASAAYVASATVAYATYCAADSVYARKNTLKKPEEDSPAMKCANIVRKHYPKAPKF
jgi:hypothetical protein